MNVTVAPSDISACHQLPTTRKVGGDRTQKKNIIVKFTNRKTKDQILRNGRLLKGSQVYVNEHLTKDDILWNGRLLKGSQVYVNEHLTKDDIVWNGRVLKGSPCMSMNT